jgi:hypothetical protein
MGAEDAGDERQQDRAHGGAVFQAPVEVGGGVGGALGAAVWVAPSGRWSEVVLYEGGCPAGERRGGHFGDLPQHLARARTGLAQPGPEGGEHRLRVGPQGRGKRAGRWLRVTGGEGRERVREVP